MKDKKTNLEESKKLLDLVTHKDFKSYEDISYSLEHKTTKFNIINKINGYVKKAVDNTIDIIDNLSNTFFSTKDINKKHKNNKRILSHTFEKDLDKDHNQLSLSSFNGALYIKSYHGDKLKVKVVYESKVGNIKIDIIKSKEKYFLSYDESKLNFISVEAFLPHSLFKTINIECINSIIDISSIKVENITIDSLNNSVKIKNIESKEIKVEVNNGNLNAINLIVKKAYFNVSSGNTIFIDCDIKELYSSSINGFTDVNIYNFINFIEYIWNIKSINGKILIKVPEKSYIGYDVKAQTVSEDVKVGLKNLHYDINSNTYMEGRSINYEEALKNIKLNLETSKAPIIIN